MGSRAGIGGIPRTFLITALFLLLREYKSSTSVRRLCLLWWKGCSYAGGRWHNHHPARTHVSLLGAQWTVRLWLGRISSRVQQKMDEWNSTRTLENALANRQRYEIMQALTPPQSRSASTSRNPLFPFEEKVAYGKEDDPH